MWSTIRKKILQVQQATGVEISLLPGEEMIVNAVVLRLRNNKIVKEKEIHLLHSIADLAGKIPLDSPVAISINGRGILYKKVDAGLAGGANGSLAGEHGIGSILPNANPNEFHVEWTRSGSFAACSIARKELIEGLLRQLRENKIKVLALSLGPGGMQNILPYLNIAKEPVLRSNHYSFSVNSAREVVDIETIAFEKEDDPRKREYNIGDQYVYSAGLLSFGSAMGLLAEGLESDGTGGELLKEEKEEFRCYKYFRASGIALLTSLFCVLLVNFFIYSHYLSKNAEQQTSAALLQEEGRRVGQLQASVLNKEKFIHDNGWQQRGRLSFYADRIAGLLPGSTVLTGMRLNQLNNGLPGENSPLTFKADTILVTGTCEDPTELNRFVNNLRIIPGIREVNIRNYLYRRQTQNGIFLMEIITG